MSTASTLILGEFERTLDDRYRLSLPAELLQAMADETPDLVLAKERTGCLSLWKAAAWQAKFDAGVELVERKISAGKLEGRLGQVQLLGRLLSTRHKTVQLAGRGRLLIPEGFREFLGVEPNGTVICVGAAVCIELWKPEAWFAHLSRRMPKFRKLFEQLSS